MRRVMHQCAARLCVSAGLALALGLTSLAAQQPPPKAPPVPGPMLEQGGLTVETPDWLLSLVRSSQTVAALAPRREPAFDFTPGDRLIERSADGYYHLGDIDVRLRTGETGNWKDYSTAASRQPVRTLPVSTRVLAAADLAPTLASDIPLRIVREWRHDDGRLVMRFTLTNRSAEPVTIGALGIPMVFNNVLTDRSLEQAHASNVFYDPYIGMDAGYLQVVRLTGQGPVLIVVPDGDTPFEAYSPILSPPPTRGDAPKAPTPMFMDPTPRGVTFEGFHDWMVHSQAFAEREWAGAQQWNPPTARTLAPGKSVTYGVAFLAARDIRAIEDTLIANDRPAAVGLPGYVLPTDTDGHLFLSFRRPVKSLNVEPAGSLTLTPNPRTPGGWTAYAVKGATPGRARLTITYVGGLVQTIQYLVTKPQAEIVTDLGRFLTTRQWFVDPADPFKRSPSVMTFDRDENRIVTQDSRVWIAGLGDEGGSSWLTGAMKLFGQPDKAQIDQYQQFIDGVVWGGLQLADGPRQYAVRKSLFYYEPDGLPSFPYRKDIAWKQPFPSWTKAATEIVDRSYNYPHVAALHWTMYRLARNTVGLVANHPWDWYLNAAYRTSVAMVDHAPTYAEYGQMEGTIFVEILRDLQREGWATQATDLEARMKKRADAWRALPYPFGSEMPWDSTGQEEVYAWTKYFGDAKKARVTLDAIVAYMPAVPHWGYNGSARRYWDFQYAGKTRRIERQLHHYGSGLNAIPVLSEYRDHPEDFHLLRIGYAGAMGALTNVNSEGFGAAAFHSFPDMLRPDGISGDFAQNFFGHAMNTATYIVKHPEFGWQVFGGHLEQQGAVVRVTPKDSFRSRVYVAPLGLWLTLDAGQFEQLEVNPATNTVRVGFAPATGATLSARLRIEQPASVIGVGKFGPSATLQVERGAYVVPLTGGTTWIELVPGMK
jgi:hypothetical protein